MVSPGSARPPGKLYLNFRYPVFYCTKKIQSSLIKTAQQLI